MFLRRLLEGFCLTLFLIAWHRVSGHGRLQEPPSRSTMWRFGFKTPHNYNDHELYCGGLGRQTKNGGKCGVCGDPWDQPTPRPNEDGGRYGNGIVVRTYRPGQVVDVVVELTANHNGYFVFKLCPVGKGEITDECMDKHVLQLADGSGHRFQLPPNSGNGKFPVKLVMSKHIRCSRCVFQWTYVAANNWGNCPGGGAGVGCGPQEMFRACADIAILDETNDVNNDVFSDEDDVSANEIPGAQSSGMSSRHLVMGLLIFSALVFVIYMSS